MATITAERALPADALFDAIGPAYEAAFAGLETQLASIEWIKKQIQSHKPAKIVDIGCGTGKPVCSELAASGHDVLGIDVSENMLRAAREHVPNARFENVDLRHYNPGAASMDVVTVYFSFLTDLTKDEIRGKIRDVYSWLKPGGVFVYITVPMDCENLEVKWMGRLARVSNFDADATLDVIKDAGFEVVHSDVSKFLPKAVEAGICSADEVWEETHLTVYAKKP